MLALHALGIIGGFVMPAQCWHNRLNYKVIKWLTKQLHGAFLTVQLQLEHRNVSSQNKAIIKRRFPNKLSHTVLHANRADIENRPSKHTARQGIHLRLQANRVILMVLIGPTNHTLGQNTPLITALKHPNQKIANFWTFWLTSSVL